MEKAETDELLQKLLERQLEQMLNIQWVNAPKDAKCDECGAFTLERSVVPFAGPFSGVVRCKQCGYRESVTRHVTRNMIRVEPLPIEEQMKLVVRNLVGVDEQDEGRPDVGRIRPSEPRPQNLPLPGEVGAKTNREDS